MRIAFVDLLFSWPPHGGADVDLYHVLRELHQLGHAVRLVGVATPELWERGSFAPDALPFPAERLDIPNAEFTRERLCSAVRDAVDAWSSEAVLLCDGFLLKPYVARTLAHYPLGLRYYAYEAVCHRNVLRFKDGAVCPYAYPDTPDICRACALDFLAPPIKARHHTAWLQEYLAAEAWRPEYHAVCRAALSSARLAVVYNETMRGLLAPHCANVHVVPGGVSLERFAAEPPPGKAEGARKAVLMTGRGEDPVKGLGVLLEAGKRLAASRDDFEIRVTAPEDTPGEDWFTPLGWLDHEAVSAQYRAADVCVVPSLWEEPFGIAALEAMASARPVCASQTGGLAGIVVDGRTGFLFPPGDAEALAGRLGQLLDDAALRAKMGAAARRRVEAEYAWERVVAAHYVPRLQELAQSGAAR